MTYNEITTEGNTPNEKELKIMIKYKKITSKQAYKLAKKLGLEICEDGRTFYATNEQETELWEFDTLRERNDFLTW